MAGYSLQPGESFVHTHDRVLHGGFGANYTDELTLTSHNLVLVQKGLLGNTKSIRVFPLNEIKVFQGHAQALVGKQRSGLPSLDVYFQSGFERFGFETKKEATFWSEKVDEIVTGSPSKMRAPSSSSAMDILGEAMSVTFGTLGLPTGLSSLGLKSKVEVAGPADVTLAGDCVSCGAPISGTRGQVTLCHYCDSPNQL